MASRRRVSWSVWHSLCSPIPSGISIPTTNSAWVWTSCTTAVRPVRTSYTTQSARRRSVLSDTKSRQQAHFSPTPQVLFAGTSARTEAISPAICSFLPSVCCKLPSAVHACSSVASNASAATGSSTISATSTRAKSTIPATRRSAFTTFKAAGQTWRHPAAERQTSQTG